MLRTVTIGLLFLVVWSASPVWAHAFGVRYELPIPLTLFLAGAAAAVGLSFLVVEWLPTPRCEASWSLRVVGRGNAGRVLGVLLQALSVLLLVTVVVSGLFGVQSATGNFATVFTWIVGWVGLALFQALVGDVWSRLNPWAVVGRAVGALSARCGAQGMPRPYPASLGCWPAVLLFLGVVWLELVAPWSEHPRTLAWLLLGYSLITWAAMSRFGVTAWLGRGDGVSLFLSLFGRFGAGAPASGGGWSLRPWVVGLLDARPVPGSMVLFVMCLLATVSLDGFMETTAWPALLEWLAAGPLQGAMLALQARGVNVLVWLESSALVLVPWLFLAVYALCCALMARFSGVGITTREVACRFAFTLVPIAIGYHLAHYLSYLLLAGQLIIPRLSDPLGVGWDLFGTANYAVDVTLMTARTAWYSALVAIILGHACAVWLAHGVALRVFDSPRTARRGQWPMLVLMVAYTTLSLWILAQPLVEG